ncbi:hypothetical protein FRX31_033845 [Thalictrum thalictroides]|uniref:Uncharacterized protein n=1 Tax=Thalictrum thalictroides TaxID=46969 RepID=A0A7J6UVR9_THATH|nr:hypothetical protein FRX31_033845 [Thalictrum thalictroides]
MSDRTSRNEMSPLVEECVDPRGWKEAIAADHVKLVLSSESEPPNPNILCSSENRLSRIGPLEPAIHGATKLQSKLKPVKNGRRKYIPKQIKCT